MTVQSEFFDSGPKGHYKQRKLKTRIIYCKIRFYWHSVMEHKVWGKNGENSAGKTDDCLGMRHKTVAAVEALFPRIGKKKNSFLIT